MATVSDHEGYYSGDIISGGEKTDLSEVSDFSDDDFTTGRKKFHIIILPLDQNSMPHLVENNRRRSMLLQAGILHLIKIMVLGEVIFIIAEPFSNPLPEKCFIRGHYLHQNDTSSNGSPT